MGNWHYFTGLKGTQADFEKPYGYAWLLKLYGEAKTWDDPEGKRVATTLEPLAKWMAEAICGVPAQPELSDSGWASSEYCARYEFYPGLRNSDARYGD